MSYPREESIQRATEVFWQKGYLGTGMRDLQTALDKRPGSIYAAFGNKEGLYLAVVEHYTAMLLDRINEVAESHSPLTALQSLLCFPLKTPIQEAHKIQCLVVKTQSDWAELPGNVQVTLQGSMAQFRDGFKAIIQAAQKAGELPSDLPLDHAAVWLQSQFIAMRTIAAGIADPQSLTWMADKIIADLPTHWS